MLPKFNTFQYPSTFALSIYIYILNIILIFVKIKDLYANFIIHYLL